jgi:hypothetical protein
MLPDLKNTVTSPSLQEPFVLTLDGLRVDLDVGHWQPNSEKHIVPIYIDPIEYEDYGPCQYEKGWKNEIGAGERQNSEEACGILRKVRFTQKKADDHAPPSKKVDLGKPLQAQFVQV